MDNISCSIVLYKTPQALVGPLILSIINNTSVNRLYLIDNSPTDALKILAPGNKIEYIFNNANPGYGAAHNIAIKKAMDKSKYHIVLNPDVSVLPGNIEAMQAYMDTHPDVGQLMPQIKYPDGSIQYTCKLLPAPADLIFRRFLPSSLTEKRMHRFEMRSSGYNKIIQVPYMSGCFMFLRLEALKKTGLFDERFFMYPEDIDLTRRIHQHYKTIFYPFAEITHIHERASYKSTRLLLIHIINMIRYFNKWGWIFDKERKTVNRQIEAQYAAPQNNAVDSKAAGN